MVVERHVTIRCLVEDLVSGWTEVEHFRSVQTLRELLSRCVEGNAPQSTVAHYLRTIPRLNALSHPLLKHFSSYFGSDVDATKLESISGLSNPHWWKQKTQQWRGAATDHSSITTDSVWLCAAGIRRKGDNSDFYTSFTRHIKNSGIETYLPAREDELLLEIDAKTTVYDAWILQIHCSALALLAESRRRVGETIKVEITSPSRTSANKTIGELSSFITRVEEDGVILDEVFLVATILDRSEVMAVDIAFQHARSALQNDAEEWHSTPFGQDAFASSAIVDPETIERAEQLEKDHELPSSYLPQGLRIGLRSHYTRKNGILNAQIEGSAIETLCGYWFVPTKDHENVTLCPKCIERHETLAQ